MVFRFLELQNRFQHTFSIVFFVALQKHHLQPPFEPLLTITILAHLLSRWVFSLDATNTFTTLVLSLCRSKFTKLFLNPRAGQTLSYQDGEALGLATQLSFIDNIRLQITRPYCLTEMIIVNGLNYSIPIVFWQLPNVTDNLSVEFDYEFSYAIRGRSAFYTFF